MNSGRYVLSQVMDLVHWQVLKRYVQRYDAERLVRHFGCRQQLICMVFAQLTWRDGLRDIEACLNARPSALHHLGFRAPVARSTLAEANEQRDWRLWRTLALGLIARARKLYAGDDLGLGLADDVLVYALDSTTIDLSLRLFGWADFRSTKAGIKLHTQLDLRGPLPVVIDVTPAVVADVGWLDSLHFQPGAFYLIDRGYADFARLARITQSGAFFVTRAKDNLRFTRHHSLPVDVTARLASDQIGKLTLPKSRADYPGPLRRIRYHDPTTGKWLIFLTNQLDLPALTIAGLYKARWQVELFFRWIKQHLRIKHFYGNSANAVKTQVWIGMCVYAMVAILHRQLSAPGTLLRTTQLLSVHPFEKTPLDQLLTEPDFKSNLEIDPQQLTLW